MAPEVVEYIDRVRQPFNVNLLAQAAALAALSDEEHLAKTIKMVNEGKAYLTSQLKEMGLTPFPSETNFILVDIKKEAKEIYEAMLYEGVIIRAMGAYNFPTCIRITVGLPAENARCITALKKVLKK